MWTLDSITMLIGRYEQQPNLYDPKSPLYFNKHSRIQSLHAIVEQMRRVYDNIDISDVKAKIGTMRSQYRLHLKRLASREIEPGERVQPPWITNLDFLMPHLKNLKEEGTSNFNVQNIQNDPLVCSQISKKITLQCRICGNVIYDINAKNLFDFNNVETLADIQMVVGTALESDPKLPSHICKCCLLDLKRAVFHIKVFRDRCILTQEQLQDSQNIIIKEEVHFDYDEEEDLIGFKEEENSQNISTNILDDADLEMNSFMDSRESVEEFEKILVNDLSPNDNYLDSSSNLIDSAINSVETFKTEACDVNEDGWDNSDKDKVKKKRYFSWRNLTKEQKIERKRQKRRRDIICDQCGKHFTDQCNFKLHMIRHSGIKNFHCKECSQQFFTEHLLHTHERIVHRGERPYACKYCDKSFQSTSCRTAHVLRYHTKARPYSCKLCKKTFNCTSSRNYHLLTHNGIRKFVCSICDKDFLRNTHLTAHLRSKQHALKKANQDSLQESQSITTN